MSKYLRAQMASEYKTSGDPIILYVAWNQTTGTLKYIYEFANATMRQTNPRFWHDVTPEKLRDKNQALRDDAAQILAWMLEHQGERYSK